MRDTWNMTPDEARKYILQNWFDGDENVNAFVCGDEEYTAMAIAVEALEATKWHYPSRGEYPKYGEWVLVVAKEEADVVPPGKWVMQYFDKSENILRSDNYFANNTYSLYASKVKCWQYIVLSKEEE